MKTLFYTILIFPFGIDLASQDVVGAGKVALGVLTTFVAPPETGNVSWCLIPNEPQGCFHVDTSSQKLYFASPVAIQKK